MRPLLWAKFVAFGRLQRPNEARLRVFCSTGDVLEKAIKNNNEEPLIELGRTKEVEVSETFDVFS